jgi:hypothetical protein
MRDKIITFLNTLDFEIEDEHLEPFIMFVNHKLCGIEPSYEEGFKPPKYFKTLLFLMNKY